MKVKTHDAGPCRRILNVEVDGQVVDAAFSEVVGEFAKSAGIPGFRKGKAPLQLVEKRFQKDIEEEIRGRLVSKYYHEALESEKISPVAVLEVKDVTIARGKPLSFAVTLDVPPQFNLPRYSGMVLEGRTIEVPEEQVDGAVESLRNELAKFEDVAGRPVAKGDLVQVDYEGVCDGKPISDMVPKVPVLSGGKGFWVLTGQDGLIPGLADGLLGANIGDVRKIPVKFPADFRMKDVASKDAEYTVTVTAVRDRKLPPVDADFCKHFNEDSVDSLRARIRKSLQTRLELEEKQRLKSEIVRQLLEHTTIDVPESQVEEESRRMVQDIVSQNAARGIPHDKIVEKRDEIMSTVAKSSQERIKADYILDSVADAEKLVVEDAEVDSTIAAMAERYRTDAQKLRQDMEGRGAVDRLRRSIRIDKALELILAQASVKTK